MKILSVRFENLNSLEGRWYIDFTHPAYQNSAIFAITGPTGAGKTTLLDAICLAIYGRTPRLKVLSKSTNELLTRQTGHCFAEVVFETVKGRFRCHWSQHRARKKPDGDLQQPRHEIADDHDGAILENTIKEVGRKVEEVTGMNFDQFTRSILLAQGSFAAFLQAPADERSPLLEQITGTEIYSTISQRVHTTTAEQQRIYQSMQDELKATSLMGSEEEKEIRGQLENHRLRSKELGETIATLQQGLGWLDSVAKMQSTVHNTEAELSLVVQQHENERKQKETLASAQRAATLLPLYHRLLQIRSRQLEDEHEHRRLDSERQERAAHVQELEGALEKIRLELKNLEELLKTEQQQAKTVRALDIKCDDLRLRLQKEHEEAKELADQQTLCSRQMASLQKAIDKASSGRDACLHYFTTHASDARLDQTLPTIVERMEMLGRNRRKHETLQKRRDETYAGQKMIDDRLKTVEQDREEAARRSAEKQQHCQRIEEEIAELKKEFPNLRAHIEEVSERLQLLERLGSAIDNHQSVIDEEQSLAAEHKDTALKLERAREEVQRLDDSVSSQLTIVRQQEELNLLSLRLQSYEEERRQLEEGAPCPLCGSTRHPYAENLPITGKDTRKIVEVERRKLTELQKRFDAAKENTAILRGRSGEYDKQRSRLQDRLVSTAAFVDQLCQTANLVRDDKLTENTEKKKTETASRLALLREKRLRLDHLENEERSLRTSLETLHKEERLQDKELNTLRFKAEALQETRREIEGQETEIQKEIDRQKNVLSNDLSPFGYDIDSSTGLAQILEKLEERQRAWHNQLDLEKQLTEQIQQDEKEHEAAKSICQKLQADIDKQQEKIARINDEYGRIHDERYRLYGKKDPDAEESRLQHQVEEQRKKLRTTEEKLNSSKSAISLLDDRSKRLKHAIANRNEEFALENQKWLNQLESFGFKDEKDFGAALLPQNRVDELVTRFEELAARKTRLTAVLDEQRQALQQEKQQKVTDESAEALTEQVEELTEKQQHHLQQTGRLEGQLEENQKAAEKQKNKRQQLARQKKELTRWQKLDELIGSANGKKFRNFAQGITFEIMVRKANSSLRMMTDRYLLIRDTDHPLELSIIDNYRAGDIRSTKNLSGGESFLVSLALALGLSKMAGNSIKVDSLFLDEGFGTLDEETLETALQTLAGLQQEGRMIGIISHVSLLKERLETQIQVIPGRGGHSMLKGPGVESL